MNVSATGLHPCVCLCVCTSRSVGGDTEHGTCWVKLAVKYGHSRVLCKCTPTNAVSRLLFKLRFPSEATLWHPLHFLLIYDFGYLGFWSEKAWYLTFQKINEKQVSDLLQYNSTYCLKCVLSKSYILWLKGCYCSFLFKVWAFQMLRKWRKWLESVGEKGSGMQLGISRPVFQIPGSREVIPPHRQKGLWISLEMERYLM